MLRKVTVSVAVGLALFTAAVRLPAATCIITNTPSEKACQPGCCANKTCCATSHERTGSPVQPLAKSTSDQQNVATIAATSCVVAPVAHDAADLHLRFGVESQPHSLAPLALICIRLI